MTPAFGSYKSVRRTPEPRPASSNAHDELRVALECLCTEAHAANLGPDRMLVAVKSAWAHVPGVAEMDVERAQVAFSCVVEHCIEAYYGQTDSE